MWSEYPRENRTPERRYLDSLSKQEKVLESSLSDWESLDELDEQPPRAHGAVVRDTNSRIGVEAVEWIENGERAKDTARNSSFVGQGSTEDLLQESRVIRCQLLSLLNRADISC
mmetsp:Transcript_36217/g.85929  ORF Transcript_36217/g.85929 Transcript_36217/m.85929 type:complete len:114 (+) Transcript_36217:115-456(+)